MLASGAIRVSHALRMELGVISENFARKTCKLGLTTKQKHTEIHMFLAQKQLLFRNGHRNGSTYSFIVYTF